MDIDIRINAKYIEGYCSIYYFTAMDVRKQYWGKTNEDLKFEIYNYILRYLLPVLAINEKLREISGVGTFNFRF